MKGSVNIEKSISINFSFYSKTKKDFNIQGITNMMEIKPTESATKTRWDLKFKEKNCDDISKLFDKVYDVLFIKADMINALCNHLDVDVDFTITIHTKYKDIPLIQIPKNFISFIALINAQIRTDFYFYN